jgi:hypothetical protein
MNPKQFRFSQPHSLSAALNAARAEAETNGLIR